MEPSFRATLVGLVAGGDGDALQQLLVAYHPSLEAAIRSRIPNALKRFIEPEDVLQEAYADAFRTARNCTFSGPAAFYKWLEKIALSRLSDCKRALNRQKRNVARRVSDARVGSTSYLDLAQRLTARDSTPSHKVARSEAVAALMTSIARLSEDQRSVVRLRFIEGLAVAQVADQLGKSEAAVHMLCHRALKALKTLLVSLTVFLSRA